MTKTKLDQVRAALQRALTSYDLRVVRQRIGQALAALDAEKGAESPNWVAIPQRSCINPIEESADAFWKFWRENGETHKHGYYESTWGAINAALAYGHEPPQAAPSVADKVLRDALERAQGCINGLLKRTPVRDVSETLAEIEHALAAAAPSPPK